VLVTPAPASCPGDLMAQLRDEKLMVVPSTADGFRAALRSLDRKDGVSFHTVTLPEDSCARLLVKNLGSYAAERRQGGVGIPQHPCSGVTQPRSGRSDSDPAKDRPPHFTVSVARGFEVSKVISLTELCGLRVSVESYVASKGPLQCKRCQRFGHTQRNCRYAPWCFACGGSHHSGGCSTPMGQPQCCGCGENYTTNYRGCVKWKEAKAALAKQAPEHSRQSVATGQPAAPKAPRASSLCRGDGPGRGVESRRPRRTCRRGYHDSTHQPTSKSPSSVGQGGS
jgi:hypothetical protein